jgi:hypothetical protein
MLVGNPRQLVVIFQIGILPPVAGHTVRQCKLEKTTKQYANLATAPINLRPQTYIHRLPKSEKSMNLHGGKTNKLDRTKGLSYTMRHSAYGNRQQKTGVWPRTLRGSLVQSNRGCRFGQLIDLWEIEQNLFKFFHHLEVGVGHIFPQQ